MRAFHRAAGHNSPPERGRKQSIQGIGQAKDIRLDFLSLDAMAICGRRSVCTQYIKYYTLLFYYLFFKENGQGLQQFGCKIPQSIPNLARHASADYSLFPKAKVLHTFQNQTFSSIIIILAELIHLHYKQFVHNCNYIFYSLSYEKKKFPRLILARNLFHLQS